MGATSARQIDALMEKASRSLAAMDYFAAEKLAEKALTQARHRNDYDRMARIVLPLQEARRQQLQSALDAGEVSILEELPEDLEPEVGCYLVRPPLVGADARRLKQAARDRGVAIAVVCREPDTTLKLCPIVAIGPGVTIRTKIERPKDTDHPGLPWFAHALESLGDFAIETLDPALTLSRRIDALLHRLDAIPLHEGLHQALADACRIACCDDTDPDVAGERRQPSGSGA
jgi:hypothetical protein